MYAAKQQSGLGADATIYLTSDPLAGSVFDSLVYGPTDEQLGTSADEVAALVSGQQAIGSGVSYGPVASGAAASFSLSAWMNQHSTALAIGAAGFVGLLMLMSGGRRR